LREDRLDATILYEIQPGAARFEVRRIHRERYLLAVHPSHRLARPGPLHFDDLSGEAFVWLLRQRGLENRDVLLRHCRLNGFDPLIGQIASSPEELIDFVMVTGGISLTPASTAMTVPADEIQFRTVPQLGLELDLNLAWNKQPTSSAVEGFLEQLNAAIDRHQADIQGGDWAGPNLTA
jgi:DNA-binding transcriptional LysR family regulator